ncbi:MAG TPA: dienelactone hydrolase family protein [Xanthobacteraceae bacterium]|nr:dienelactone hydrolase family protein [Xanthobacteraceae bacterium]
MSYRGMVAEVVEIKGHNGDTIEAYYARPLGSGPYGGVVLIHHAPGWDEWIMEATRKLAHHGFAAIAPHLYHREGGGGSPDDAAAKARGDGGVHDAQVMGDIAGSMAYLRAQPHANGKVGVIGFCSGGRHAYLAGCSLPGFDAVVDCWGGNKLGEEKPGRGEKRPVAPITLTGNLTAPVLGIYGNDDKNPSPADVNVTEETLKRLGKKYEFHRYDGAGHGFFNAARPAYRPEQAIDGWNKVYAFFEKYLTK